MGNRFGWILGGSLVLIVLAILVWVIWFPSPSKPTYATTKPGVLDFYDQTMTPNELTGREPTGAGNAAECYHQAYTRCMANDATVDAIFIKAAKWAAAKDAPQPLTFSDSDVKMLAAIADLVGQGARRKEMQFAPTYTPELLIIGNPEVTEKIVRLQKPLLAYAFYHASRKEYADAERVLHDMLTMGRHFVAERSLVRLAMSGMSFQRKACSALRDLYGPNRYAQKTILQGTVRDYLDGVDKLSDFVKMKRKLTRSLGTVEKFPGDVLNIAENDADRLWRIEGILKLGQLKFTARSRGDKRHIKKLIGESLASDDPLEAAAAKAADAYTIEEYRMSGSAR